MRRLKANSGTECPSNFVFLDCESNQSGSQTPGDKAVLTHRLTVCSAVRLEGGRETRRARIATKNVEDVWRFIAGRQDKYRPLWVFAHNIHFDVNQLKIWDRFLDGDFTVGPVDPATSGGRVRGQRPWRGTMCIRRDPYFIRSMGVAGKVYFVSTTNYLPESLAKLRSDMGEPEAPLPAFSAPDAEWFARCEADVDFLERTMLGILARWRAGYSGVWAMTAAGLAVHSWRHTPGKKNGEGQAPDVVFAEDEAADEWERSGYYGGYAGAFYTGPVFPSDTGMPLRRRVGGEGYIEAPRGPVYKLDVSSLYPAVMHDHCFPRKRLDTMDAPTVAEVRARLGAHGGMAEVEIESEEQEFPCIVEGRLSYATGRFRTTLCGPELKRACDSDSVRSIRRASFYSLGPIFKPWVRVWWARRLDAIRRGDHIDDLLCKMVLNSLSGKPGQRPERWVEVDKFWNRNPEGFDYWHADYQGKRHEFRSIAGVGQVMLPGGTAQYGFPAISAFIAGHARERMRALRGLCPSRTVLHQATDALLVLPAAYRALCEAGEVHPRKLGKLRLLKEYTEGEIQGTNWYCLDGRWTRTGWYGKAEKNAAGKWQKTVWESCESQLTKNPDGRHVLTTHLLDKCDPTVKGEIDEDGFVFPWHDPPDELVGCRVGKRPVQPHGSD